MTDYIRDPHTTIFNGPTGCGKSHLVLNLLETEYNKNFDYIIIICLTLRWNKTYHAKIWLRNDEKVWLIQPNHRLYQWIEKLSQFLASSETLFIINYFIADEGLDKKRQSLLEWAISSRHRNHYLWLLTQSYSAIPKKEGKEKSYLFGTQKRADLKMIHDENNMLTDGELVIARDLLKMSKHVCLCIRNGHPCQFKVLSHI